MTRTTASLGNQGEALKAALARAQTDRDFRARLFAGPRAVLDEAGAGIAPALDVRLLDGGSDTAFLVLPPPPAEGEVSDSDLATASGGTTPVCVVTVVGTLILSAAVTADVYLNSD